MVTATLAAQQVPFSDSVFINLLTYLRKPYDGGLFIAIG